jgi:hypothetical protein
MTKSQTKKKTRGGARKNAGAKTKYNEATKTISFRCPASKVDEMQAIIKNQLLQYQAITIS